MFQVQVQDEGAGGTSVDCIMGISVVSLVFIEDHSRQIILVVPTNTLLGKTSISVNQHFKKTYFISISCLSNLEKIIKLDLAILASKM